ncbi:MAG: TlyA family RNA methyltransferase [Clostridiales bacterium]|nr:TlyA family RNA methyltransferase [Clostridiales bacterium]
MAEKTRLDAAVYSLGLAESREKAKALIMAGQVYVNNQKTDKAGAQIKLGDKIELRGGAPKYVSRGGLKLEKAADFFSIDLNGKVCMDVGASTGGFTDCMLQRGAKRVYAIDVGYGQLAWKLRCDDRVKNFERTNFRYLTAGEIGEKIDFASVDVSFISLSHILPNLYEFMHCTAAGVCLIKPQFEAGREKVGKKGVVRDEKVHIEVVNKIIALALDNGFEVLGLTHSPIKGPEGNIEYLLYIKKCDKGAKPLPPGIDVKAVVENSHRQLLSAGKDFQP